MKEEHVVEIELTDKSESDIADAVETVMAETISLLGSLGKATRMTLQDITSVMIVKVDRQTRERLDLLVDAGVARNRRAALKTIIEAGLDEHQDVFDRVRETKARIAALRSEMRTLVQPRTS